MSDIWNKNLTHNQIDCQTSLCNSAFYWLIHRIEVYVFWTKSQNWTAEALKNDQNYFSKTNKIKIHVTTKLCHLMYTLEQEIQMTIFEKCSFEDKKNKLTGVWWILKMDFQDQEIHILISERYNMLYLKNAGISGNHLILIIMPFALYCWSTKFWKPLSPWWPKPFWLFFSWPALWALLCNTRI